MSDVASRAYESRLHGPMDATVAEPRRVRAAANRLGEANHRLSGTLSDLESTLDRLCGGAPKGHQTNDGEIMPSQPDLDELDGTVQSICDRCAHLEDLVRRASAL